MARLPSGLSAGRRPALFEKTIVFLFFSEFTRRVWHRINCMHTFLAGSPVFSLVVKGFLLLLLSPLLSVSEVPWYLPYEECPLGGEG